VNGDKGGGAVGQHHGAAAHLDDGDCSAEQTSRGGDTQRHAGLMIVRSSSSETLQRSIS
jgi:hypothetical protein